MKMCQAHTVETWTCCCNMSLGHFLLCVRDKFVLATCHWESLQSVRCVRNLVMSRVECFSFQLLRLSRVGEFRTMSVVFALEWVSTTITTETLFVFCWHTVVTKTLCFLCSNRVDLNNGLHVTEIGEHYE